MTTSRDLALRLAASATLLTALVGCGEDAPRADPAPSTSSPTEAEPSPTDEATDEPAVQPATGPQVQKSVATVRVPETWATKNTPLGADAAREPRGEAALEREVFGLIDLEVYEAEGSPTLDQAAREAATYATTEGKRVEDEELGGEPAFVITDSSAFGNTEYTTGLARDGAYVWLTFSLLGADKRDRQDLIDSVVATWEWQP